MSDQRVTLDTAEQAESGGLVRPRIRVTDAVKSFDGRVVVDVDDLTLGEHPIEGLIGPNGAGKTTLLRMIMHSVDLDDGRISYLEPGGADREVVLSELPPHEIARLGVIKTNQVIQDFENLTIWDSLLLSLADPGEEGSFRVLREEEALFEEHHDTINWYLDYFEFEDPASFALSAGEKKLLDIIRCLLLRPRVLLLDEPAAGLPEDIRDRAMEFVREKALEDDISVVIVEHDLSVVWSMSDFVHFMAEGSVILQGDPSFIRQHETVVEKYLGSGHVGG